MRPTQSNSGLAGGRPRKRPAMSWKGLYISWSEIIVCITPLSSRVSLLFSTSCRIMWSAMGLKREDWGHAALTVFQSHYQHSSCRSLLLSTNSYRRKRCQGVNWRIHRCPYIDRIRAQRKWSVIGGVLHQMEEERNRSLIWPCSSQIQHVVICMYFAKRQIINIRWRKPRKF